MKIKNKLIALIPARSGSERIKNKNILNFFGHPLLAYSIKSAIKSKIFDKVLLSTDSQKYANIAKKYGAEVPFLRPKKISKSTSNDFEWISYTLKKLEKNNEKFTHFFILRPTNPLRSYVTIRKAWNLFKKKSPDSLRAVESVKQHPGKMWIKDRNLIKPLLNFRIKNQPSYNNQIKILPNVLIQNASLEISKTTILKKYKTITGKKILPFFTSPTEGLDINYPEDLINIKNKIHKKLVKLPKIVN
jgi:CMP-N,N'-diacetyllegionaminic acid synthase